MSKCLATKRKKRWRRSLSYPYPVDLPVANRDVWDAIAKQPEFIIGWNLLKSAGKDKDAIVGMAVYRNFYEAYVTKLNKVPWNNVTKTQVSDQRLKLKGFIIQGEEKARKVIDALENHLIHADLIKKSRAQKFHGICRNADSNHYQLTHVIPWVLDPAKHTWLQLASFIKREFGKNYAFREAKNKLITKLNTSGTVPTEIEIIRNTESLLFVYVNHTLTEHQASVLTQEVEHNKVHKVMEGYCKFWYKSGKFPRIDEDE